MVDMADYTSKFEQILNLADVQIGAFEERESSDKIFYTGRFFKILNIAAAEENSGYMVAEDFKALLNESDKYIVSETSSETLYNIEGRWVRLNKTRLPGRTLGVVLDITKEINEKTKIQYERDHDTLTQLYNRRAFYERAHYLFGRPEILKTAAVVMLDLDDLKSINDNFGHETGDRYIGAMADALLKQDFAFLVARLAGDEFAAVFYGAQNKDEIRAKIALMMSDISKAVINLSSGSSLPLRASAGIAWYPEHSEDFHILLKKSDIAMYKAKNTKKSTAVEFTPGDEYLI